MPIADLPDEVLVYLLGSRYCETDRLSDIGVVAVRQHAARLGARAGDLRLRARPHHLRLPARARDRARAFDGHEERKGVCRDFAHLAVTFCRCMNIPARYCTGYLGDIGVPAVPDPMDFSAWFEAYLGGRWYTFDARHNKPRIGRILMARGRDATDVAISTTFGAEHAGGLQGGDGRGAGGWTEISLSLARPRPSPLSASPPRDRSSPGRRARR